MFDGMHIDCFFGVRGAVMTRVLVEITVRLRVRSALFLIVPVSQDDIDSVLLRYRLFSTLNGAMREKKERVECFMLVLRN